MPAAPAWMLECIDGAVPCEVAFGGAGKGSEGLRVGRAVQPPELFEALLPNEGVRFTVSREHFLVTPLEKCASDCEPEFRLTNLSSKGTLLNGVTVHGEAEFHIGDLIGIGCLESSSGARPALQFRVRATDREAVTEVRNEQAKGSTQKPLSIEATPVVKINVMSLPPPFTLECSSSLGLSPAALAKLPRSARVLQASCMQAQLRVGRTLQDQKFWADLLPDEALRNTVSREHFELSVEDCGLWLKNLSGAGTLVNGQRILEQAWVQPGDVIGIGAAPQHEVPSLSFRLLSDVDTPQGVSM